MSELKEYIGDNVYVDYDGWDIILTTENGEPASNTIVLEPEVMKKLIDYTKKVEASR